MAAEDSDGETRPRGYGVGIPAGVTYRWVVKVRGRRAPDAKEARPGTAGLSFVGNWTS
jgi:hypothetical protein